MNTLEDRMDEPDILGIGGELIESNRLKSTNPTPPTVIPKHKRSINLLNVILVGIITLLIIVIIMLIISKFKSEKSTSEYTDEIDKLRVVTASLNKDKQILVDTLNKSRHEIQSLRVDNTLLRKHCDIDSSTNVVEFDSIKGKSSEKATEPQVTEPRVTPQGIPRSISGDSIMLGDPIN